MLVCAARLVPICERNRPADIDVVTYFELSENVSEARLALATAYRD